VRKKKNPIQSTAGFEGDVDLTAINLTDNLYELSPADLCVRRRAECGGRWWIKWSTRAL